jgi:hypothetical protein
MHRGALEFPHGACWFISLYDESLVEQIVNRALADPEVGQMRRGGAVAPLVHSDSGQPICECGIQGTPGGVGLPAEHEA